MRLASGILKLSQTIYPTPCLTAGILSHMPSHVAKFPVPELASQAAFLAYRFERRSTGPVKTCRLRQIFPPCGEFCFMCLGDLVFLSVHHVSIIGDEEKRQRLENLSYGTNR